MPTKDENDLFFALKGAGASYGITTEFLYKVFPRPETKPVVLFVYFNNPGDFRRLQRISDSGQFQIAAYRVQHFVKLDGAFDNIVRFMDTYYNV